MLLQQLEKLAEVNNTPCVSIAFNTHRTHPKNEQDVINLKNFISEAENRVIAEHGKRSAKPLLESLTALETDIDVNYNLDSLHIFLSNDTKEIMRSPWKVAHEAVHLSDRFALRSIIKDYNRTEHYMVMVLSQSGVYLYEALNDSIVEEIENSDFPFPDSRRENSDSARSSESEHLDDLMREFLNQVDKALINVHNENNLNCIVVCTADTFSKLIHVSDKPSVYIGNASIDYNNTEPHQIAKQSWELIKPIQKERRSKAIAEMKEAVAQGKVFTDLQEIFQASMDGRGDLLLVHQDFSQSVSMTGERTFDRIEDSTQKDAIDDISSTIAWDVMSKGGRVFFVNQDEIKDLGDIVLKTRYWYCLLKRHNDHTL